MTPIASALDGTQIWKITHNGVDTHPIHFHLYDIQLINRVTWDNIIIPPEPTELGWKDTVRVSPLEDTIVAIRPIVPTIPFGVPDSIRPLNPMMPIGARGAQNGPNGTEAGFNNTDANGNPIAPIVNEVVNFYWEYVWHCHILSHEEMDMMRPVSVFVARALPDAPVLTFTRGSVILNWTDSTVVDYLNPATWANPKNEIGFRIERALLDNNGQPGDYSVIAKALANTITYTDLTADPGLNYSYRVSAFNVAGETPSNLLTVTAPPPGDPTNLLATVVNPNRVDLSWTDNATSEQGFTIERALVTNGQPGTFSAIDGVGANILIYTDSTVLPNTTYAYRVLAFNLGGNSAPSNIATVTTSDVAPAAPSGLSAVLQNGPQVGLTWTDNANNETSFVVQISVNAGAFADLATLPANTISYTDTAVTAGNTYTYQVMAANAGGPSTFSNTASVTISVPPAGPVAPSNLRATLLTNPARVRLTFRDNAANETGFVLERADNGGTFTVLATLQPRNGARFTVTYTDSTVLAGSTYAYRVKAVNGPGSSAYSNTVTITMPSAPAAPSNFTATTQSTSQTRARIDLRWIDNSNNETRFVIQRATNIGFTAGLSTYSRGANTTSWSQTGLRHGVTYYYRIMAQNGVGGSVWVNLTPFPITTP